MQGSIIFLKLETRRVLRDHQRGRLLPEQGQNRLILALQAVRGVEKYDIRLDLGKHGGRAPVEHFGTSPDSRMSEKTL